MMSQMMMMMMMMMTMSRGERRRGCSFSSSSLLVLVIMVSSFSRLCYAQHEEKLQQQQHEDCGIYLAPSTIPGAGLGMFSGTKLYKEGELVADSDLVIPVFELEWHNGFEEIQFLWDEYVWAAYMFPGMEEEAEDIDSLHACSGGFGAAINCVLPLVNVEDEDDSWSVGMSGIDYSQTATAAEQQSPGAGAFTPFYGRKFVATKTIEPGSELYISYGETYFESRQAYESVPLSKSYETADMIVRKFLMKLQFWDKRESIPSNNIELHKSLWQLVHDISDSMQSKRLSSALPGKYDGNRDSFEQILQSGGTSHQHYNASIRSLDWLAEHGQCMDNIKDGVSTIPHAGRGAFANRFIPKDGLVAPAPLIQLPYRDILTMYATKYNTETKQYERDLAYPNYHIQLLLNYCFGHKSTTILLCPYGLLTALINHGHKEKANTKIQWSSNERMRHPEWFEQPISKFKNVYHAGLAFDFVALRDIEEDEEILIDYGDEWQAAWEQHVQEINMSPPRPGYIPAFQMNKLIDDNEIQIRTQDEFFPTYDHEGIVTCCWNWYIERDGLKPVQKYSVDNHPCRVIQRNVGSTMPGNMYSYVVELWEVELGDFDRYVNHTVVGILFDVPRDAFYFYDSPYTRDHHQPWSFRHDMRIPDDMLPDIWKNVEDVHQPDGEENEEEKRRPIRSNDGNDDDGRNSVGDGKHHKRVSHHNVINPKEEL